jgi:hypothetical protein
LKVNEGFVSVGGVKLQTIETCGLSLIPFFRLAIYMMSSKRHFVFLFLEKNQHKTATNCPSKSKLQSLNIFVVLVNIKNFFESNSEQFSAIVKAPFKTFSI